MGPTEIGGHGDRRAERAPWLAQLSGAPPDAYAAVVAWNRKAFTVQVAVVSQLFQEISDDIAGDIFEFLEPSMSRTEWMHVATNCSSPEARTWVRSMMAAAVAVSDVACFK